MGLTQGKESMGSMDNTINWVGIENLRIRAFHGVHADEQILGSQFIVNLEVQIPSNPGMTRDDLEATLDYGLLNKWVHEEMAVPTKLIETVAYRIADRIKANEPRAKAIELSIRKLNPQLRGQVGAAYFKLKWENPTFI